MTRGVVMQTWPHWVTVTLSDQVNTSSSERCGCDFKCVNFKHNLGLIPWVLEQTLPWNECQRISIVYGVSTLVLLMAGAARQQTITWTSVDQDIRLNSVTKAQRVSTLKPERHGRHFVGEIFISQCIFPPKMFVFWGKFLWILFPY